MISQDLVCRCRRCSVQRRCQQLRRDIGVIGVGHQQQPDRVAVRLRMNAFDLAVLVDSLDPAELAAFDESDRGSEAAAIVVGIVRILGDRGENQPTIRQTGSGWAMRAGG